MNKDLVSSKNHDWRTPGYFLDLVRLLAVIVFDPATADDNPTGALIYSTRRGLFSRDEHVTKCSGLTVDWVVQCKRACAWLRRSLPVGITFINSPYGKALPIWVKRACLFADYARAQGLRNYQQLLLVPARTETVWFKTAWASANYCLLWGSPTLGSRIRFVRGGKKKHGAMFPNAVFFWGDEKQCARFAQVFGEHGLLLKCSDGRVPMARVTSIVQPKQRARAQTPPGVATPGGSRSAHARAALAP